MIGWTRLTETIMARKPEPEAGNDPMAAPLASVPGAFAAGPYGTGDEWYDDREP